MKKTDERAAVSNKKPDDSAKMLRLQRRIGERIKKLRLQHNPPLAQGELAGNAGMDPATLNQIERGHRMPDVRSLYRLAEALKTSFGSILDPGAHAQGETGAAADRLQGSEPAAVSANAVKRRHTPRSQISLMPSSKPLKPGERRDLGDKLQALARSDQPRCR